MYIYHAITNVHVTTNTYVANISLQRVISGWSYRAILLTPVYVVRMYICINLFYIFRDGRSIKMWRKKIAERFVSVLACCLCKMKMSVMILPNVLC